MPPKHIDPNHPDADLLGKPIAFKGGSAGKYLRALADADKTVDPNGPNPGKDSTFTLWPATDLDGDSGEGRVFIETSHGTWLGTRQNGDCEQHDTLKDGYDMWTLTRSGGKIQIRCKDMYDSGISDCRDDVASLQTSCRDGEKWTIDFDVSDQLTMAPPHKWDEILLKPLALKGSKGKYLRAKSTGEVDGQNPNPGIDATFTLAPGTKDKVIINTSHGTVLGTKRQGDCVTFPAVTPDGFQEWDVKKHSDGRFTFTHPDNYNSSISDCRDGLASMQTGCRDAEKWTIDFNVTTEIYVEPHKFQEIIYKPVSFKGSKGNFLRAKQDGTTDCQSPFPGKDATFKLKPAPSAPKEKVIITTAYGTVLGTKSNGDCVQQPEKEGDSYQEWDIKKHSDGRYQLSNKDNHNSSISDCRDGLASMQTGCRDAEKWTVNFDVSLQETGAPLHRWDDLMNKPLAFKGSKGKYLQALASGEVDPNAEFVGPEAKFTVLPAKADKERVFIKTTHNTLLKSKRDGNTEQVAADADCDDDEREWDVKKHSDGRYSLIMVGNYNSSISDCRDDCASMQTGCRDSEKWTVVTDFSGLPPPPAPKPELIIDGISAKDHKFPEILGKPVAFKGSKGMYLRCLPNEDKEIVTTGESAQAYETYTILPGKGKENVLIKTHHGTFLGTKYNGDLEQHDAFNEDWEQWVVTKHAKEDKWSFLCVDNHRCSFSDARKDGSVQTGCRDTEKWTLDFNVQEGVAEEKHPFAEIVNRPIAFKAPTGGKYVRVLPEFCKAHEDNDIASLVCDRAATAPMAWETFTLIPVEKPKGHAYIKTSHGTFLTSDGAGHMLTVKDQGAADSWGITKHGDQYSFKYPCQGTIMFNLSAQQSGVNMCTTPGLRDTEKWTVVDAVQGLAPEDQAIVDEMEVQRLEREAEAVAEVEQKKSDNENRVRANESARLAAEEAAVELAKSRSEQLAKRDLDAVEAKKEADEAAAAAKKIPDHPAASLIGRPLALKGSTKGKYLRALPGGEKGEVDPNGEMPMQNETFVLFAGKESDTVHIKTSHGTFLSTERGKDCRQALKVGKDGNEEWKVKNHGDKWSFLNVGNYNSSVSDCRADVASMQTGCRDSEKWTVDLDIQAGVWVEKHPFHEILDQPVAFKGSKQGRFIRAIPKVAGETQDMRATTPHTWETFIIEAASKKDVTIKSSPHGYYLGGDASGGVVSVPTGKGNTWAVKKKGDKYSFAFTARGNQFWLSDCQGQSVSLQTRDGDNEFWSIVFETIDAPAAEDQKILDDLEFERLVKEAEAISNGKGGGKKGGGGGGSAPIPGSNLTAVKSTAVPNLAGGKWTEAVCKSGHPLAIHLNAGDPSYCDSRDSDQCMRNCARKIAYYCNEDCNYCLCGPCLVKKFVCEVKCTKDPIHPTLALRQTTGGWDCDLCDGRHPSGDVAIFCIPCKKYFCPQCEPGKLPIAKSKDPQAQAMRKVDMKSDLAEVNNSYINIWYDDEKFPFCVLPKFARKGNLAKVQEYYEECTPAQRCQALMCAAVKKHKAVVDFLLSKKVDPNYQGKHDKYTALHLCIADPKCQDLTIMKALLDAGANINATRKHGISVLQEAFSRCGGNNRETSKKKGDEIINWLLKNGADVNHIREDGESCLHTAVYYQQVDYYEICKGPGGKHLDMPDKKKNMCRTPLFMAGGHIPSLKELVRLGVKKEVVVIDRGGDSNALDTRCHVGDTPAVQCMIEELGFNKNFIAGEQHWTLLHSTAMNPNNTGYYLAEYLITKQGFKVDATDDHGNTALHYAADLENWNVCKALLQNGAKPKVKNSKGFTAFDMAGRDGTWERKKLLELAMEAQLE